MRKATPRKARKRSFGNKMDSNKREFLGTLCNLYMTALLAVVPLYTGGTYYLIGDTKYRLFRNVSVICLGLWLLVTLGFALWNGAGRVHAGTELLKSVQREIPRFLAGIKGLRRSPVDVCMLAYGLCVLLSAVHSPYGDTPWLGYQDWYMGAFSQLMFVGIYFFVSRNYDGSAYPIYLGEAALFLVAELAFANRLGQDPLGLLAPFNDGDWEYSHMLSTVGNINWLCGYLGVAVAFPLSGYLNSRYPGSHYSNGHYPNGHYPDRYYLNGYRKGKCLLLFFLSTLGVALLALQGSDIGVVMAGACLGVCLLAGYLAEFRCRMWEFFEKGILLAATVLLLISVFAWLMGLLGTQKAMPSDSPMQGGIAHPAYWAAMSLLLYALFFLLKKLPGQMHRMARNAILVSGCLAAGACAAWYFGRLPGGEAWGSGRGRLWSAAWRGFLEAGALQKLLGAGPDCFAEYIYSIMPAEEVYGMQGRWEGVVFANAHNEWLNHLVNIGILGAVSYLGIFVSAFKRYRGMLLGILALALYGLNSLTSFQQTLNTPLFFLALGLCESRVRREYSK